jgi:hypothetical protein
MRAPVTAVVGVLLVIPGVIRTVSEFFGYPLHVPDTDNALLDKVIVVAGNIADIVGIVLLAVADSIVPNDDEK